jgi:hypothetical protein
MRGFPFLRAMSRTADADVCCETASGDFWAS